MEIENFINSFETKLQDLKQSFVKDLKTAPSGRAHPSMLDDVLVGAYGSKMPLKQLAAILAPEANTLQIKPFDSSQINAICEAISKQEQLNLNPTDDGQFIYLTISPLTTERRQEIVKIISSQKEDCLIKLRQIRHNCLKEAEEEFNSKDEIEQLKTIIDGKTVKDKKATEGKMDKVKKEIDQLAQAKIDEILKI